MRETLDKMLKGVREYFAKMTRANRIRLAILAGAVVVLAIVAVSVLSRTRWVELQVDMGVANDVYAALGGAGIQARRDGFIIEVPEGRLAEAQMHLYEMGLVGTPVFDDSALEGAAGFSVSAEHARQLYDTNTANRIATQLRQNRRISNALVIVNSGESSPFRIQTNTRKPTASVQVTLNDGGTLSTTEAQTIAEMVRASVPGIEYEDISISDSNLNLYNANDGTQSLEAQLDQRIEYENRLAKAAKEQVEQLLYPIYGLDNIQVSAFVRLNFDRTVINKIEFEPPIPGEEEGMKRTMEEIRERSRRWAAAEGIPGTDENNLGTAEYPWGYFDEDDVYMRDVMRINYDLNEIRTAIEVAQGGIEEFGITVLINSQYMGQDVEDAPQYTAEIREATSRAIGVAPGNISVQHLPFNHLEESLAEFRAMQEAREARERLDRLIDQIFMYGTILALGVLIFILIRMVLKTFAPPPEPELLLAAEGPPLAGIDLLIEDEEEEEIPIIDEAEAAAGEGIKEIDLEVEKSAVLEQIEKFIDKDAEAVAQLLRNWLSDEMY